MRNMKLLIPFPVAAGVLVVIGFVLGALACTPKQGAAIEAAAPGAVKAACVILDTLEPRAVPFCATADDFAPYAADLVKQLEAARAVSPSPEATAQTSAPLVAMSLDPPKRTHHVKRHCARWDVVVPPADAAPDGSSDSGR
jgi:hypothetical protein